MSEIDFIEIRRAEQEDLPEILKLEEQCFSHPWRLEDFEAELSCADSLFLVAKEMDVLGFVILRLAGEEAEVYNIAVSPLRRRCGLGHALLKNALDLAEKQGVTRVYLEVRASNTEAMSLYHSLGFETVGLRRGYYDRPVEDAVIMALSKTGEEEE